MSSPQFVWIQDSAPYRNQFVRFERILDVDGDPGGLALHLFADTRYRLRVNGKFVAAGPGRFVTQFPEFDTHDLAPLLRLGSNVISVEVNFFGASSFQSMPDGKPGFIAWGGNDSTDLATPGEWQAFRVNAWRWDAPLFSFAQNPVEICDTRIERGGDPRELVVLQGDAVPWGELMPYSGVPIPYFAQRPKRIELAGNLENGERRFGFMSNNPGANRQDGTQTVKQWRAFATWIWSPEPQTATLSCFWSILHCNGNLVSVDADTPYGNHAHCTIDLTKGWNLLVGEFEVLTEFWAYCLGIPDDLGLSLHGCRDNDCTDALALSAVGPRETLVLPSQDVRSVPEGWVLHDGDPLHITPARMMAWDMPSNEAVRGLQPGRLSEVSTIVAKSATWCFSFEGEFLGHIVLDVEAPAGTILDLASDDWQAANGGVALYRSNPFTDAADRFILRGGRQRIEVYHPRGGKLIQATMRAPGGEAELSLHDLFVRSRQTTVSAGARFECGQTELDWVWPVALRTVIVSTDESYSDCPWRERGSYIGDGYVNISLDLLFNRDHRTARRTLRIFAQAQLPSGQLACCAPAWLRRPHEDFTLIWLLAVRDFWALTGDTELIAELWPTIQRIWTSESWKRHASGLWNTTGARLFIDWGVVSSDREGDANAVINVLRAGAAVACADMADAIGLPLEAASFRADADAVETALIDLVWNDAEGRFLASMGASTPALHANVLALAFGIGDDALRERILQYLEPKLRENFANGTRQGQHGGHLELYFLHYALPALAKHGRPDLAELLIEQHYGFLRSIGDDTLPECFSRVDRGLGSRCHSWSGAAAIYAARYVLGLRPAEPGNPDKLIFAPIVHDITRASGRIVHPDGWIEVDWHLENGEIIAQIQAPEGVQVEISNSRSEVVR